MNYSDLDEFMRNEKPVNPETGEPINIKDVENIIKDENDGE